MKAALRRSGAAYLVPVWGVILVMSAYNSAMRTDAHHWGLMISNALDLTAGEVPYRDFIIQYGLLTTWIQSLWGRVFGFSFLSFGLLTAIAYCGLLHQVHATIKHLSTAWAAALFVAVAFILHPFPIYPWADYYAGFFLSCAIALLFAGDSERQWRLVAAGILFGLSVWSRYTYAAGIVPFLLTLLAFRRVTWQNWRILVLSFTATNVVFFAVLEFGCGINLDVAARVYWGVIQAHGGTSWLTLERLKNILFIAGFTNAFFVYLWLATLPLFVIGAIRGQLDKRDRGTYVALTVLGFTNLIHAFRLFEYFRVVNCSFALAIVSFWMIGVAVRSHAEANMPGVQHAGPFRSLAAFVRSAPPVVVLPLAFVIAATARFVWGFPLNTYNTVGHDTGIWRSAAGLKLLTYARVGQVGFSRIDLVHFYRRLAAAICPSSRVISYVSDNLVGYLCDHPIEYRRAYQDRALHSLRRSEYQHVYVREMLTDHDAVLSIGTSQRDLLCLKQTKIVAPYIEYVALPGTAYVVRTDCKGRIFYGIGWSLMLPWAQSEHAELHLVNYANRPLRAKFTLTVQTQQRRTLRVSLRGTTRASAVLIPGRNVVLHPGEFVLEPGDNLLAFDGDAPAVKPTRRWPPHLTYNVAMHLDTLTEDPAQ